MPVNAVKGEIEVELTHKCNWNCEYCAIHVHSLPEITEQDAIKKVESIHYGSFVTLSGGEPGLLSRTTVERCIEVLQSKSCTICLNTNGEFIRRYPDLLDRFYEIVYHCSQDLNADDVIFRPNMQNIHYMVIVTDNNVHRLREFLARNNDLKFDIVEATYNHLNDGPTLSSENKHWIVAKFCKHMTRESVHRWFHEKEFDQMEFI